MFAFFIAKVKNAQATKATVSKDGKTWTFNIRKNAKWPNGQTLTAKDFVYPARLAVAKGECDRKTWLNTDPLMEEKYRRRVDKVKAINDKHCVPVK